MTGISRILKELEDVREGLQLQYDSALAEANRVKADLQRIDRILKAAEPPQPAKPKSPRKKTPVSEKRRDEILRILSAHPKGLTAVQVGEEMGAPSSSVLAALHTLRSEELVRAAGVRQNGHGRAPTVWKAMSG